MTDPTADKSSWQVTGFLRGIAIVVVIVGHYALSYEPGFYSRYLSDYSMILSLFFILSGYGIAISLQRRTRAAVRWKALGWFYFDRGLRIYPLYWLMLAMVAMFPVAAYLRRFDLEVATIVLGAPTVSWFVSAILQCYLVAPLLFYISRRWGPRRFAWFNLALMAVSILVSYRFFFSGTDWSDNSLLVAVMYRQFFIGHIVLFSFGMMLPAAVTSYGERLGRTRGVLILALAGFLLSFYLGNLGFRIFPLFVAGAFTTVLMMLVVRPRLPFGRLVVFLGGYSYALYIFHRVFFMSLDGAGITVVGSTASIIYSLLLSPILVAFCVLVEHGTRLLRARVRSWRESGGADGIGSLAVAPGGEGGPD